MTVTSSSTRLVCLCCAPTTKVDISERKTGVLNKPKYPKIPTLSKFKGKVCHTARWPKDLVLNEDTVVAVLGGGASGVQHIVDIQPNVKKLYHWIRSTAWVTPAASSQYAGPSGFCKF